MDVSDIVLDYKRGPDAFLLTTAARIDGFPSEEIIRAGDTYLLQLSHREFRITPFCAKLLYPNRFKQGCLVQETDKGS